MYFCTFATRALIHPMAELMNPGSSELSSSESGGKYWIDWFMCLRGNEYFCAVDQDYIADRFNLTGLMNEIPMYNEALELILDQFGTFIGI